MPDGSDTPDPAALLPKRARSTASKIGPRKAKRTENLSPRRERFVKEYVKEPIGQKAAARAGYSPASAHVTASRLLTDPKVKGEIDYELARIARRQEISADRVVQRLAHLSDMAEDAGQYGAAANCEVALGKHLNLFQETKVNLNIDASGAHLAALLALAERRKTKVIDLVVEPDSDLS